MSGLLYKHISDSDETDPMADVDEAVVGLESRTKDLHVLYEAQEELFTAEEAIEALKEGEELTPFAAQWINRTLHHTREDVGVSLEDGLDESTVASLESNVKAAVGRLWKSILQTIRKVYEWGQTLWERYRRSTEHILMKNRDLRIGLKRHGGRISDATLENGLKKMLDGPIRPHLHRLAYDQGGNIEFGKKTISVFKDTAAMFRDFADQDMRDAEAFKAAISNKNASALEDFESKRMKDYGAHFGREEKMLPNTKMIGAVALFAQRGQIVVRPTVQQLKFIRRRQLEISIRRFARPPILMDFTMEIEQAVLQVRSYNTTAGKRVKLANETQREIQKLLDNPSEDLAARRRIAVAWSKVAFRRSDLVSLALIRAMDAALKVIGAFVV